MGGVKDEIRLVGHGVDFVDGGLQRSRYIRIRRLVETDVAIADLYKGEVRPFAGIFAVALGECPGHRDAATHGPDQARASPCHALQEPAAIHAALVEVLQTLIDEILLFVWHLSSVFLLRSTSYNSNAPPLFPANLRA